MAPLKFALLGSWHSHASMHVEEAARRPDEFRLLGMYDSDAEVVAAKQPGWAELHGGLPVFPRGRLPLTPSSRVRLGRWLWKAAYSRTWITRRER